MLNTLRKNHQVLTTVIVVIMIICFAWLYNPLSKTSKIGSNDVASVYGRIVQKADIDRQVRGYQLAFNLGLTDFIRDLGGLGENEEASLSNYILNLLVVQHQAEELGIRPTDDLVASRVMEFSTPQSMPHLSKSALARWD